MLVRVNERSTLALPAKLRAMAPPARFYGAAQRNDGVFELRPRNAMPMPTGRTAESGENR